jgi:phosphoglycerol transferase MdoB-like AlkP superfamily enzyme
MEEGTELILGLGLLGVVLALIGLILYIWSIIWVYRDAEQRRRPGILIAILVAFIAWPLGLIVWLFIRPDVYSRNT